MRKVSIVLILMAILLTCASALADDGDAYDVGNMPGAINAILDGSEWSGWEITGWVNPKGLQSDRACAFAAVKSGSKNDLIAFGWSDGEWKYKWHNAAALPQVDDPVVLVELEQDTGFMSYYVVDGEVMETRCIWKQKGNGTWRLVHLYNYYPLMFFDTSVENVLRLYNTGWSESDIDVSVQGSYQTDLRYFDLGAFPKTVEEAREKLSNPPKIPAGTLSAKEVQFTSGEKYEVFQGPGKEYGQAGNGKAIVSTNDWIQVFGEESGWILIQYNISSDHMRMGWIPADALPSKVEISELVYSPVTAMMAYEVNLTDDPLNSQTSIATIAQGTEVNWLASMGEWAYIEKTDAQPLRGFVKIESLEIEAGNR